MIQFILNNRLIETEISPSTILLDFIRYHEKLKGTKAGCREGDCGACTVLVGSLEDNKLIYKSMASCLTPLGNIAGKHVLTVEGINNTVLTPVQSAIHEHNATQCGFCTPGIVVSLTGFAISEIEKTVEFAKYAVSGNICRCTGYKSIEKALDDIVIGLKNIPGALSIEKLIEKNFLPEYFITIPQRIKNLKSGNNEFFGNTIIGGGTDLYVQKPDEISETHANFILNKLEFKGVSEIDEYIEVGASVTVSEIMNSEIFQKYFPEIRKYGNLISSEQIRNVATVAGNFVNASPIGDLSIFFLALNAELIIVKDSGEKRTVLLKNFFKAYKTIDLINGEYIEKLRFKTPKNYCKFNFEKVSKRTRLDIASVNTAVFYCLDNHVVKDIHLSGGGVAPVPKYLDKTVNFLRNKELNNENIRQAAEILVSEVSPVSDIRGSKEYKSMLLKQLFLCHFDEIAQ
jgi:xanthine dehydrogenase small subunit